MHSNSIEIAISQASNMVTPLLLAPKGSHLEASILPLEDLLRDKLGWSVAVYWIDGEDSHKAYSKLRNVIYTFQSNVKARNEKLVVYYGGHSEECER